MRILTISELMRVTFTELKAWESRIMAALNDYADGSPEQEAAYVNLGNIRMVLARPECGAMQARARRSMAFAGPR